MTAGISGHNIVIQQSGAVNELTQGSTSPKPSPVNAAAQQAAETIKKGTTVQEFDEAERLKAKKEKETSRKAGKQAKKKKENQDQYQEQKQEQEKDPDDTGRLLDTII